MHPAMRNNTFCCIASALMCYQRSTSDTQIIVQNANLQPAAAQKYIYIRHLSAERVNTVIV